MERHLAFIDWKINIITMPKIIFRAGSVLNLATAISHVGVPTGNINCCTKYLSPNFNFFNLFERWR